MPSGGLNSDVACGPTWKKLKRMNDYAWAGEISAPLAVVAGILTCFFGYRILKLSLVIIGFSAGAYAGWELGLSMAHGNSAIPLVGAFVGGLIGAGLCLGLYFLGIFLAGATAGAVLAAALFNGTGHSIHPIFFLAFPLVLGLVALVAQKFMIIVSTAISGSYLIVAGFWPFVVGDKDPSHIWLHPVQSASSGMLGYGALAVWLVLALLGFSFQFRRNRKKIEVKPQPA